MKKVIKLVSLVFILSITAAACGDKKECEGDGKKECCKPKVETTDSATTTETTGDEQAHVCTDACEADPHSCPHHTHDH